MACFFGGISMPSTVVADMNYDSKEKNLRIRFVSGMVYEYLGVPERVFLSMRHAASKGIFLNRHIKGRYEYRRVN